MDLAAEANISARHLSFLETGKAQPSREMVIRLGGYLKMPLRQQNVLLSAAGFAAAFEERSLEELTSAYKAIEQILQAHKPYPAFAVDRHWNIILSNRAIPQLYVDCSPEFLSTPVNAVRLMLHPRGLAPRIVNLAQWRAHVVAVLRQQAESTADRDIEALLAEVLAYPTPRGKAVEVTGEGAQRYATPLQIATDAGIVSFLNTTTVFGSPSDVTLSEIALEMLFPGDAETVAIVEALTHSGAAR